MNIQTSKAHRRGKSVVYPLTPPVTVSFDDELVADASELSAEVVEALLARDASLSVLGEQPVAPPAETPTPPPPVDSTPPAAPEGDAIKEEDPEELIALIAQFNDPSLTVADLKEMGEALGLAQEQCKGLKKVEIADLVARTQFASEGAE